MIRIRNLIQAFSRSTAIPAVMRRGASFPISDRVRRLIWVLVPLAAASLAYSGVVRCGFIGLDDDLYVYANRIVSRGLTWEGVRWAFSAIHASTWQPLVWISYMVDVSLGGVDPAVLHRTNLLLHLLNIRLFHHCCLRLFGRPRLAALAALLFAVHPVHVESVAWIAARKDVLSTPFWWAGILAYLAYVKQPARWRYAVVAVVLMLGLMAKPMLMTLPVVLLLLDTWPLRRVRLDALAGWKTVVIEKLPLLLLVLLSFAVTCYVQAIGESILDMETVSLWGRFSNAAVSLCRYAGKLLWPVSLAVLYPHPGSWPWWITWPAVVSLLAVLGLVWRSRLRFPWLLFGCAWFLITLFPVIGLIQFGWHSMADRFLYIPAAGLYIAVAHALAAVSGWSRPLHWPLATVVAAVVLALVSRTQDQVALWQGSLSLFSHAARVTHDNWMMHNGVGAALSRQGRHDEAALHFEEAIRIKPERPKPHYNLGHARFMQQRWAEAVTCFERSLALRPTAQAYYNLAVAHRQAGHPASAEAAYRTLLDHTPGHVAGMVGLAGLCRADGRQEEALAFYRQAREADPANTAARTGMGVVLLELDRPVEALKELVDVLRDDPSNLEARKAVQQAMHPGGGE